MVTSDIQQILLTVGGVLFVGVALWLWFQQEKRTYEKKKREADKNGWTYQRFGKGLHRKYRHLPIVDGDSVRAKHVMRGQYRGRPITMFTLAFRREEPVKSRHIFDDGDRDNDGKRDTRQVKKSYGVVSVGVPTELPKFELSAKERQGKRLQQERSRFTEQLVGNIAGNVIGAKAGQLLFGKDYTGGKVEMGDPQFDDVFVVRSTEPDRVRALLTPQARAWLLKSDKARKYVVWCDGQEIITWGTGTDTNVGKVKANYLNDLLDQLPAGQLWGPPPS